MKLSDRDIKKALDEGRIGIDPRPDDSAIKGIGVDLKLGNAFRIFQGHSAGSLDLSGSKETIQKALDRVMSDEILLGDDEVFYLHPGTLALASTYEVISVPDDLVGWIDGRSSLARLGLMVHVTAHRVDPGWQGQIVLEIYNSGKLPLALRPKMDICALFFEPLTSPAEKPYHKRPDAKYKNQRGPIASRIDKDNL